MNCKVCNSELQTDIDNKILSGCSYNEISNWCRERGFKISPPTIKRHALSHLQNPKTKIVEGDREGTKLVNFDAYCKSLGLSHEDFENLEENLEKVIYGSQKAISIILFKNLALVNYKLSQNLNDLGSYPMEQIKGMRLLFEMYTRLLGLEMMVNENKAIQYLESLGHHFNGSKVINVESEND
ncbi:MAG: hypothetical protein QNJ54_22315 [Prochloraceae cyanobacterium]|nr:hypothetical protein [Prochloraceae cyanobacterium]